MGFREELAEVIVYISEDGVAQKQNTAAGWELRRTLALGDPLWWDLRSDI